MVSVKNKISITVTDVAKKRKHKLFKRKKLSKGESNKTVVQSDSQTSLSSEHDSEGHGEISVRNLVLNTWELCTICIYMVVVPMYYIWEENSVVILWLE